MRGCPPPSVVVKETQHAWFKTHQLICGASGSLRVIVNVNTRAYDPESERHSWMASLWFDSKANESGGAATTTHGAGPRCRHALRSNDDGSGVGWPLRRTIINQEWLPPGLFSVGVGGPSRLRAVERIPESIA